MKLMYAGYLPIIVLAIVLYAVYVIRYEVQYFNWVRKYFFLDRSWSSRLSTFLYLGAMTLLLISLLDFRGPEQKLEADIPDQRTIIIIDSSASMLAEDVRPNRFQKSLLLARHFIKKAAGHQIAVVLFSDTQKRLVPFTDDIDLLDARVAGLSKIQIENGGSNIKQAIAESLQYFKAQDSNNSTVSGNLLIFTDSESNEESFDFKIPDSVNIAMIGVGTARGAPIPLRSNEGVFRGYKKFNNEKVISKLDERFLKSFSDVAKNYKYWISTSFTIPTEKILDFFRSQHRKKLSKGLVRSRPVYSKVVLLPAIILFIMAFIVQMKPSLSLGQMVIVLTLLGGLHNNAGANEENKPLPLDKETQKLLSVLGEGELDKTNRLKIAEGMLKAKDYEKAKILYQENILFKPGENHKAQLNYGTLLLAMGDIIGGAEVYQKIHSNSLVDEKIKEVARKNLLLALNQMKEQEKKNKDDKNKKKDEQNSSQSQDQNQQSDESKQSGDKKQNQQNQQDQKKNDQKNQNKDEKNDKNKEKEDKNNKKKNESGKDGKKKEKKKSIEEKEQEIKQKRKMVKIPAMLKQIMSDDSQLQKKYIDTSTKQKNSQDRRKDW